MLALLAFVASSQVSDLSISPCSISDALRTLSIATGRSLSVSPSLSSAIVVAHIENASSDEVLGHLAKSLRAEWAEQSDHTLMLRPSIQAEHDFQRKKSQDDAALIDGSLAYVRARLAEEPDELSDADVANYHKRLKEDAERRDRAEKAQDWANVFVETGTDELAPSWRALARIVIALGDKPFLAMPDNARAVFAENPTPMQQPLPEGSSAILTAFRREFAIDKPNSTVARVRVVITRWETSAAANVTLDALDASGVLLDRACVRMNNDGDVLKVPYTQRHPLPPAGDEKPIQFPSDVDNVRLALGRSPSADQVLRKQAVPKVRRLLVDPVRNDPTSYGTALTMLLAAKAKHLNLIGPVSDYSLDIYSDIKPWTPSQALVKYQSSYTTGSDDWLVTHLDGPLTFCSRSRASQLIRRCIDRGGLSLDDAASWTAASPEKWPFVTWINPYVSYFTADNATNTATDSEGMRFWAYLGAENLSALIRGEVVDVARLNPKAKEQLAKMVYWFGGLDDKVEPTEVLPSGIIGGTITCTVSHETVFIPWRDAEGEPAQRFLFEAEDYGRFIGRSDPMPADDRFLMGTQNTYTMRIALLPGNVVMTQTYKEDFFAPDSQPLHSLPSDLQAAADKARKETKGPESEKKSTTPP